MARAFTHTRPYQTFLLDDFIFTSPSMDTTLAAPISLGTSRPLASRRPRFRRDDPPPIRLTGDDIAIIRHVAEHRFLRSTHVIALLDRPAKKILERLAALYHNAYLDRPRAQLDYYATAGSAPYVYALGNKGAALLTERYGTATANVDWTDKNRTAGRVFIEHTLMIADFMVALECAVRRRSDLELIHPVAILAGSPSQTRRAQNPWKLSATINHPGGSAYEIGIIPDKVFGLDFTQARKRSYFFLEADRATMPVARSNPKQTSFNQKIFAYLAGGGSRNTHGTHFGVGNFRVLTITTSPQRMETMVAAQKTATKGDGSRQLLFADYAKLRSCPRRALTRMEKRQGRAGAVGAIAAAALAP
jgi:hypothetical protein